ncbi:hypothetical protein [Marinomonas algarum]|uniref:Uncharacterized protein n=1 Tax=Marinomonas algarum TaxID=2883105 RepID=A0A9X1LE61_9GAMM|nr:hypothetical protein [Marinomonas algarum]MCB5160826.1 hypothetical protein [Marinomonas algarum]
MLIFFTIVGVILCVSVLPFLRWRAKQKALKEKILARLSSRSEHLLYSIEMVSDRYLIKETKIFIFEHLVSVLSGLVRAGHQSEFVTKKEELVRMATELRLGQMPETKDRVSNQEQFDHMGKALSYLIKEIRVMPENFGTSRALVRHHLLLLRYANALAYRDLLVHQAKQDLDNDRKSQALEKLRDALAIIEKNGSVELSKKEKARLQMMIKDVESRLFTKDSSETE